MSSPSLLKRVTGLIQIAIVFTLLACLAVFVIDGDAAHGRWEGKTHVGHDEAPGRWAQPDIDFEVAFREGALLPADHSLIRVSLDSERGSIDATLDATIRRDPGVVLHGTVPITHLSPDRLFVIHVPGQGDRLCNAGMPADPSTTEVYGPWHPCEEVWEVNATASRSPVELERAKVRYKVWRPPVWKDQI